MVLPTLLSKNHERGARGNSVGTVIQYDFASRIMSVQRISGMAQPYFPDDLHLLACFDTG